MFCRVRSAAITGVDACPVMVEADVSDGMPQFAMVGYVSSQVKEAQDRVRTALRNLGVQLPPQRVTINLAPGDLRKDGTRFDLPIAAAVLLALGKIPPSALEDTMLVGELHLNGAVERVTGVLPIVLLARENGCRTCVVPAENVREGRVVEGIRIVGVRSLQDLLDLCRGSEVCTEGTEEIPAGPERYVPDFSEIRGQDVVKRAALIAAAGFHNLLMSGAPGTGKSMTASRIPTILPELTAEESLEISRIYSIAGLLPRDRPLMTRRPFRAPHHTITPAALCGSGFRPRPGEITLAHRGVLFLDELPEMRGPTLELLRQPLEDRCIVLSRAGGMYRYPASFLLVAAMNPCPCGYYPDRSRCMCTEREVKQYQARISQALLDRIDLYCEMPLTEYRDLTGKGTRPADSASMREKVVRASERQKERYAGRGYLFNSEVPAAELDRYCTRTGDAERMLEAAFRTLRMSARSFHHVLRTARTIADLDGAGTIAEAHVSEALCFRSGETGNERKV